MTRQIDISNFQKRVSEFKASRDWHKFHQPKDLLLGMVEEIGEFRNIIKWEQDLNEIKNILVYECDNKRRENVENFFGDMLWYLASLAEYCEIDLEKAMFEQIKELESRFPIDKVKGTTANPETGGYDGKYVPE